MNVEVLSVSSGEFQPEGKELLKYGNIGVLFADGSVGDLKPDFTLTTLAYLKSIEKEKGEFLIECSVGASTKHLTILRFVKILE